MPHTDMLLMPERLLLNDEMYVMGYGEVLGWCRAAGRQGWSFGRLVLLVRIWVAGRGFGGKFNSMWTLEKYDDDENRHNYFQRDGWPQWMRESGIGLRLRLGMEEYGMVWCSLWNIVFILRQIENGMFCWLHTRRSFIDFNDLMITILIFPPFCFQSFHFSSGLPFGRELPLFVIISLAVSLPSVQSLSFLDTSIPCPSYI